MSSFESILWGDGGSDAGAPVSGETIADLNLDQIFVLAGGAKHVRAHHRPLTDLETVRFRQEVFADLADGRVRSAFEGFVAGMASVRKHLERGRKLHHPQQRDRWQLDAETVYCRTVRELSDALADRELRGRGLRNWRDWLAAYASGPEFATLADDLARVREGLDSVRYTVHVDGRRLVIDRYAGQPDYSATIAKAFERFGEDRPGSAPAPDPWPDMNEVEEQVIAFVAEQHPLVFRQLAEHTGRYREFVAPVIARFDAEIAFYLDYLWMVGEFGERGLPFTLPEVTTEFAGVAAEGAYDVALAPKLFRQQSTPVGNDFRLDGAERILVVTGPNQGGKSTFARTVGQLGYLAALGCPVPGTRARIQLPDRIFTHFVRADDVADPDGGLARELSRLHDILSATTGRSLLVLNESLSTTAVSDAVRIGGEILRAVLARGATAVFVTFLEELADLGPEVVSMVAGVVSDDDTRRTFRMERRAPDGVAHATVLAERHGLGYRAIRERVR